MVVEEGKRFVNARGLRELDSGRRRGKARESKESRESQEG
jgi:hypothetical protein